MPVSLRPTINYEPSIDIYINDDLGKKMIEQLSETHEEEVVNY